MLKILRVRIRKGERLDVTLGNRFAMETFLWVLSRGLLAVLSCKRHVWLLTWKNYLFLWHLLPLLSSSCLRIFLRCRQRRGRSGQRAVVHSSPVQRFGPRVLLERLARHLLVLRGGAGVTLRRTAALCLAALGHGVLLLDCSFGTDARVQRLLGLQFQWLHTRLRFGLRSVRQRPCELCFIPLVCACGLNRTLKLCIFEFLVLICLF